MKKGICLLLSVLFILSCLPMAVFADAVDNGGGNDENADELYNVTQSENAMAYASSEKTSLWTPAKALIDGQYSKDTWQGWEVGYPDIVYGADTSAGFSGQYYGVKFRNREYYEIHDIYINLGLHAAMGGQNAHFTVQCLVEGVWVTVLEFSDSDAKPLAYESYEEAMAKDTSFYHIPAEISFKLDAPVTTNNVRVTLSEYGKNYPGGDVLIFPYVYEIVLNGKRGETPELELPEGAVVSANIGYHSYPEASSSVPYRYPYCAIDGKDTTFWSPRKKTEGQSLSLVFADVKKINKAVINFGKYQGVGNNTAHNFTIEALIGDKWTSVANGNSLDENVIANINVGDNIIFEFLFDEVEASALRIVFPESFTKAPTVYELEAHMSTEKTYYVEDRFSVYQRSSASKGNIAVTGVPYANLDFAPYSDVNYIIDGRKDKDAYVWFTGVVDMPSYCGIKFHQKQLIDRVALYFFVPEVEGADIMSIQIQAMIDGEYKTLVETKSYHKDLKYSPAFKFEPVETDDIRILYTAGNGTFAHLKEIEAYSPNGGLPMFDGLEPMEQMPEFIDLTENAQNAATDSSSEANGSLNNEALKAENVAFKQSTERVQPGVEGSVAENPAQLNSEKSNYTAVIIVSAAIVALAAIVAVVYKKRKN